MNRWIIRNELETKKKYRADSKNAEIKTNKSRRYRNPMKNRTIRCCAPFLSLIKTTLAMKNHGPYPRMI